MARSPMKHGAHPLILSTAGGADAVEECDHQQSEARPRCGPPAGELLRSRVRQGGGSPSMHVCVFRALQAGPLAPPQQPVGIIYCL